eukprot:Colp12_sorted_trinity150504_noHs@11071
MAQNHHHHHHHHADHHHTHGEHHIQYIDHDDDYEMTPASIIFAGAFESFLTTIQSPFENTKILSQTQRIPTSEYERVDPAEHPSLLLEDDQWDLGSAYVKAEGTLALFRALGPAVARNFLQDIIAESFENILLERFVTVPEFEEDEIDWGLFRSLLLYHVVSASLTAALLNPLSSIQTRLVVQQHTADRKYTGILSIRTIASEEGPLALYHGAQATAISAGIRAVFSFSHEAVLALALNIEDPAVYVMAEWAWNLFGIVLRMPFDTAARRLQLQGGVQKGLRTLVPTNALVTPYKGTLDCITRVAAEEGVSRLYCGLKYTAGYITAVSLLSYLANESLNNSHYH